MEIYKRRQLIAGLGGYFGLIAMGACTSEAIKESGAKIDSESDRVLIVVAEAYTKEQRAF